MNEKRVKTIVDEFTKNDDVVEPTVLEVEKPEPVTGVVEVAEIYVREAPVVDRNNTLGTIKKGDEVEIDMEESTDDFYKVYTAKGLEGFCMKQFIRVEP